MANLAMSSIELVDARGQQIVAPVLGQQIFYRARWTASGFTSPPQYVVRYTIGGVSVDSSVLTLGDGTYSWYRGITYASPGNHEVSITVDGGNAVDESIETDNTLTASFAPVPPSDLPQKFMFPVVGVPNRDYAIGNYVDVDPRFNSRVDFRGGPFQYDGHDAIDVGPSSFTDQDQGVAIVAAAAGTVTEITDGYFDRETTMSNRPGNYLTIDHGNGWQTVYFHFAANSIVVKIGDTVSQGQLLGLMGSSGSSTASHLHWNVRYRGATVETFYSPTSYWVSAPVYQGDAPPKVMRSGISNYDVGPEISEGPSSVTVFPTPQNWNVYYWFNWSNLPANAQLAITWYRPNGTIQNTFNNTPNFQGPGFQYWSIGTGWKSSLGTWSVAVSVNGVELDRKSFTVVSSGGEPEASIYRGSSVIVDNRVTPIDFGAVALGGAALEQTFTIINRGAATLTTVLAALPGGFSLVGGFPSSVAANAAASFTVRMNTSVVGRKLGEIRVDTNDNDESQYTFLVSGEVTGSAPTGSPAVTLPGPAVAYAFGAAPVVIDRTADINISGANSLNGVTVRAEILTNGSSADRLAVRHQGERDGEISVAGTMIIFGGQLVAAFSGGSGTIPLVITFTDRATIAAMRAVLRNLTYVNTATMSDSRPRFLGITCTDAEGLSSQQIVKRVSSAPGLLTNIVLSGTSIAENNIVGATIGTLVATSPGMGSVFTHTFVENGDVNDNASFTIAGDQLRAAASFNFEAKNTYTIRVRSADQYGYATEQMFTITVTNVNEEPTLTATGLSPTYTEDAAAATLYSGANASTIEAGQLFTSLSLRVSNVSNGSAEVLVVNGIDIPLVAGSVTAGNINSSNVSATVTLASTTATVVISHSGLTKAELETLVNSLRYMNTSQNPTAGNRVVTITQLVDNGSNVSPNDNTNETLAIVSTVTVVAVNDAPVAVNDTFSMNEDATLSVGGAGVKVNDSDPDNVLTAVNALLVSNPSNAASFSFNTDGTFNYRPNTNYFGQDTFTYKLNDGALDSNIATVTITVAAVNDAPTITVPGPQTTDEDTPRSIPPITVGDVDATTLAVTLSVTNGKLTLGTTTGLSFSSGSNGTATFTISGTIANVNTALASITYGPNLNFNGSDSLIATVSDLGATGAGGVLTATGNIAITVNAVNDAPYDIALSASTVNENTSTATPLLVGTLSASDFDVGDTASFSILAGLDGAIFVVAGNQLSFKAGTILDFETKPTYQFNIRATDSAGATFDKVLQVSVVNLPEVSAIQIEDGAAQRSMITKLAVSFDSQVVIGANGLRVRNRDTGQFVGVSVSSAIVSGNTVATLRFLNGTSVIDRGQSVNPGAAVDLPDSLADGNYELLIDGTAIAASSGGLFVDAGKTGSVSGSPDIYGDQAIDHFYRLFGDADGDRDVDALNNLLFRQSLNTVFGNAVYRDYFDWDGDGDVDGIDNLRFRQNLNKTLPF